MKVTTVNIYNVLSKILTACFETRKGEPLDAVDTSEVFKFGSFQNFKLMVPCMKSNHLQQDADIYLLQSLYMFWVSQHPSSGVLKIVAATCGTGHTVKYKD